MSNLSEDQFKRIFPKGKLSYYKPLVTSMGEFGITTLSDVNDYLATLSHESQGLTIFSENLNYSVAGLLKTFPKYFKTKEAAALYANNPKKIANLVYANRMGNGNEQSGDGWKYRGRGPIQITGKSNYIESTKRVGIDLVNNPDLLVTNPEIGIKASCEWYSRNVLKRKVK